MVRLVNKIITKKDAVIQWHTQAGKITTNLKVRIDFALPGPSATKIMMQNCHVYDTAKGRYDMIIGRCLLT